MRSKKNHSSWKAKTSHAATGFSLESLESRQLLTWGAFPVLIHQDQAAADYPSITGSGETVAILDTGVNASNPSLSGKVIAWKDFVGSSSTPVDAVGHGTGVTGMVAASGFTSPYDGDYYQGIAPDVNIIMLRTDTESNSTPWPTQAARISSALDWVIANRTKYNIVAVNMSTGQGLFTDTSFTGDQYLAVDQALSAKFATLANAGVYLGAASGNDGPGSLGTVEFPAADPNVYSAGSVNASGQVSSFSSRGPLMDLLAPGENVTTTYYLSNSPSTSYVNYATGTSFSSPAMVGAAALIKQINPSFTPAQINTILVSSGTDVYDSGTNATYKLLNVDAALRLAYSETSGGSTISVGRNASVIKGVFQSNGTLDMAWYDASAHDLQFAQRDTNGNWGAAQVVDSSAYTGTYLSINVDSTGLPGIAYYDATNGHLKYAQYDGSSWQTATIDSTQSTGQYCTLTYDQNDNPAIAYYAAATGDLRVAALNTSNQWTYATVDSSGDVGKNATINYDRASGNWVIIYDDSTHNETKVAVLRKGNWITSVADSAFAASSISLSFTHSLHIPVMSYYGGSSGQLRYSYSTGRRWYGQVVPMTGGKQGQFNNVSLTSSDTANVVYWNQTANTLVNASYDGHSWTFATESVSAGNGVFAARNSSGGITAGWLASGGVQTQDF